jgi:hypothetical protein
VLIHKYNVLVAKKLLLTLGYSSQHEFANGEMEEGSFASRLRVRHGCPQWFYVEFHWKSKP